MKRLEGRYCLITGASRGLGADIARTFWEHGASLLLVARSGPVLREFANSLSPRSGQHAHVVQADLSDPAAIPGVVDSAKSVFPAIDVLVNNAAIHGPIGPLWTNDWDAWQRVLQVNLLAAVSLCRHLVPWMARTGGGRIINISGGGATGPRPNFSAYGTAKAALVRFSETLAAETAEMNITVNCLAPGIMKSQLISDVLQAGPAAAGTKEFEDASRVFQSGGADTRKAAELSLLLASPEGAGISGKLISAVWDPWDRLGDHHNELRSTDIYTLRRIVPRDRGMDWG